MNFLKFFSYQIRDIIINYLPVEERYWYVFCLFYQKNKTTVKFSGIDQVIIGMVPYNKKNIKYAVTSLWAAKFINVGSRIGRRAVKHAIFTEQRDVVEFLMKKYSEPKIDIWLGMKNMTSKINKHVELGKVIMGLEKKINISQNHLYLLGKSTVEVVKLYLDTDIREIFIGACMVGNIAVIDFLKQFVNIDIGLYFAALKGQINTIEYLIGIGAADINKIIIGACDGGKKEIIDRFNVDFRIYSWKISILEKAKHVDYEKSLELSVMRGKINTIRYIEGLYSINWNVIYGSAKGYSSEITEYAKKKLNI